MDPDTAWNPINTRARFVVSAGIILCAGLGACGADPASPGARNVLRIVDPTGRFGANTARIDTLARATIRLAENALAVTGVIITITPDASRAIPGYGVGGHSSDANTVQIFIDAAFPGIDTLLAHRLPPLVAHEMHHAKRWSNPGYGSSLLEAMVSEGLADHFAQELLGTEIRPWSNSFPDDQTAALLTRAQPEFDSRSYNHARWFFNVDSSLPPWTGYTIGYRLVRAYILAHPGSSAVGLVTTPANAFRPPL
jgi:uncharacterized protein YjaZ